jgi:DNA repair protein RadC
MKVNKKENPSYIGHRKRIKEKYKKAGLTGWLNYEILELALGYAISRKDTKPIAKKLLAKFKTFNAILDAKIEDLQEIEGVSQHTALFLKFLKDIAVVYSKQGLYKKELLSSPRSVYNYLKVSLKGAVDEKVKAIFLNNRNYLVAIETIQEGVVNKSVVYPRKIVERALYHHAAAVIIAHNHPGGSLIPSKDDYEVTKAVRAALNTVDIALLDHIIVGADSYFSFKESTSGIV